MRIAQSLESPTNVKNTVVIVAQAVLYTARRMAERLIPICSANLIFDVEYKILLIHERHTTTLNGMFSSLTNPHALRSVNICKPITEAIAGINIAIQ